MGLLLAKLGAHVSGGGVQEQVQAGVLPVWLYTRVYILCRRRTGSPAICRNSSSLVDVSVDLLLFGLSAASSAALLVDLYTRPDNVLLWMA